MILTKGYITSLPETGDNHFKVRVPLMEDNTGTEAIFDALLCTSPSTFGGYSVGDTVYVHFEDNFYNECVILGKLFTEVPSESSAYVLTNELKVTDTAYLPPSTHIGDYTAQDLTNLYSAAANGGTGTGTVTDEQLKNYVKWEKTEVQKSETESYDVWASRIKVMPASNFDNIIAEESAKSDDERWTDSSVANTLFFVTSVPNIKSGTTKSDPTNVYSAISKESEVITTLKRGKIVILLYKYTDESENIFYSYQTYNDKDVEVIGYISADDLSNVSDFEYGPADEV